jgi:hypothetical protein
MGIQARQRLGRLLLAVALCASIFLHFAKAPLFSYDVEKEAYGSGFMEVGILTLYPWGKLMIGIGLAGVILMVESYRRQPPPLPKYQP